MDKVDFATRCIHGSDKVYDTTGAVSMPIFQTATFAHEGLGKSSGFDYSRLSNPTRERLQKTVAALEGGYDAIAFSSGMATVSAVMEFFEPGDHIIASEDLYGGSLRYFRMIGSKRQITYDFIDTSNLEQIKKVIKPNTKAIYIETPTNPMMYVTDIKGVVSIAHDYGLKVIVDNTFMTPYFQKPIALGADIVIHSGTKFLGGHNDTLAGIAVVTSKEDYERLYIIAKTLGAALSPFDSWLIIRGIKTLPLRMERQQDTAIKIAQWLEEQLWVNKIYYVGSSHNPGIKITKEQATGYGAMISLEADSVHTVEKLLNKVKIIQFAESLGGTETLITYPMTQTHADVPLIEREAKGINEKFVRLSVGLEAAEDLIADLSQAVEEE